VLQWKQTRDVFGGGDPGQGKRGFPFFFLSLPLSLFLCLLWREVGGGCDAPDAGEVPEAGEMNCSGWGWRWRKNLCYSASRVRATKCYSSLKLIFTIKVSFRYNICRMHLFPVYNG
jgi:hypothetical protein